MQPKNIFQVSGLRPRAAGAQREAAAGGQEDGEQVEAEHRSLARPGPRTRTRTRTRTRSRNWTRRCGRVPGSRGGDHGAALQRRGRGEEGQHRDGEELGRNEKLEH